MTAQVLAFASPTARVETGFSEASVGIAASSSISFRPPNTSNRDLPSDEVDFRHLRDRLSGAAAQELSAQEVLFVLLNFLFGAEQAGVLARQLLNQFGSFGAVLKASPQRRAHILPDCQDLYTLLSSVHRAITLALREPIDKRPLLKDMTHLRNYLRVSLAHEENEVVRLLFLDGKNRLLRDDLHARGTVHHTPVYPREIVRRVLEVNASAIIIVHNHPTGDPTPSHDDVAMTRLLARLLKEMGVNLHDHLIVGRCRCSSMRSEGLLAGIA